MRDGELVDALGDAGEAARRLYCGGGIGLLEMRPQPGGACEASSAIEDHRAIESVRRGDEVFDLLRTHGVKDTRRPDCRPCRSAMIRSREVGSTHYFACGRRIAAHDRPRGRRHRRSIGWTSTRWSATSWTTSSSDGSSALVCSPASTRRPKCRRRAHWRFPMQ